MKTSRLLVALGAVLATMPAAAHAQCGWIPGDGYPFPYHLGAYALAVYGDHLIAAGRFTEAGGAPARNIARWDGQQWHAMDEGIDGQVTSLAVYGDELVAVGQFKHAGSEASVGIARWRCVPVCYANCDSSFAPPHLNVADLACFINRFAAGDPYANCDGSTGEPVLTALDFACCLNRFAQGCP